MLIIYIYIIITNVCTLYMFFMVTTSLLDAILYLFLNVYTSIIYAVLKISYI